MLQVGCVTEGVGSWTPIKCWNSFSRGTKTHCWAAPSPRSGQHSPAGYRAEQKPALGAETPLVFIPPAASHWGFTPQLWTRGVTDDSEGRTQKRRRRWRQQAEAPFQWQLTRLRLGCWCVWWLLAALHTQEGHPAGTAPQAPAAFRDKQT